MENPFKVSVDKKEKHHKKLKFEDLLALTIAGFQVLLPYVIIFVCSLFLVLLFLTKIWIK
ncbi:hypothetical protein ACFIJ5_01770 [Haloimpatiens sp. FM7330]|uniref:hypothetical protein n=1 Tax=Haloimpatiens sp. FM7330 TaxID=3298610 RepID=UPI00364311A1